MLVCETCTPSWSVIHSRAVVLVYELFIYKISLPARHQSSLRTEQRCSGYVRLSKSDIGP